MFCFVEPESPDGQSVSGIYREQEKHHGSVWHAHIVAEKQGQSLFLHSKSSLSNLLEIFSEFL